MIIFIKRASTLFTVYVVAINKKKKNSRRHHLRAFSRSPSAVLEESLSSQSVSKLLNIDRILVND